MTHKGENYSVKMQKYYFCNGTLIRSLLQRAFYYKWIREQSLLLHLILT